MSVLGRARLRLEGGNVAEEFGRRFGPEARDKVLRGEVTDARGRVVDSATELPAGSVVYHHRDLPREIEVPFDVPVLHRDHDIVVVDKPHFLATMPRGSHVVQTALFRLRRHEPELPRPFRSWAYPLTPLLVGGVSLAFLLGALCSDTLNSLLALALVAAGGLPALLRRPTPSVARPDAG